jgi:hypothetical protein
LRPHIPGAGRALRPGSLRLVSSVARDRGGLQPAAVGMEEIARCGVDVPSAAGPA